MPEAGACDIMMMSMRSRLKEVLERAKSWPESDQEELVEVARDIEARRGG
jgi:hypothetical protein